MSAEDGSVLSHRAASGDAQALAKLLTWLERAALAEALALKSLWEPPQMAFRFGITGPPGAGKSTLVSGLITYFRQQGLKIGVIAVDPSSPFTGGAVLGDRIRYSEHFLDSSVFIRSLGTRGSLGGLSSAAFLMARAFDLCAFDLVLIETVGVGQTELDILHVADQVGVVLVPESGDSIQAMKAGLMEIADIFVVNKADRPGADSLAREIDASLKDGESSKAVSVLKAVASEGKGIAELGELILRVRSEAGWKSARGQARRWQEEAKALLRREWENSVAALLAPVKDFKTLQALFP